MNPANIVVKLKRMPMFGAVAALSVGILFFDRFALPRIVAGCCFAVLAVAAVALRRRGYGSLCLWAALFVFGGVVGSSELRLPEIPDLLGPAANERLARLELPPDEAAVVRVMGAGDSSAAPPELRADYARCGVAHILAVSGLHAGIVYMLFNVLFRYLILLRHGNIVRSIAVLVPVWLYVAVCGFPPSAVRAAVMFTALQIAEASSSRYLSLNALSAAAFVMLAADPGLLFDVGFRLSFTAVAAIVTIGSELMNLARGRNAVVRAVWNTLVISLTATAATAPIVANTFGVVPLAGFLINAPVLMCAYVIVGGAVLWIALPVPLLGGLFSQVLGFAARIMNSIVRCASSWEHAARECTLSDGATAACYGVMILCLLLLWSTEPNIKKGKMERK